MKGLYIHIPFCRNICSYCDFCKFIYNEKWVYAYFKALKNSYTSEANNLNNSNVLATVNNEKDKELTVTYNFNYSDLDSTIKEKYNLTDLNHNQIKKYEEEGYKCK